jgi:hypothetical protein
VFTAQRVNGAPYRFGVVATSTTAAAWAVAAASQASSEPVSQEHAKLVSVGGSPVEESKLS